MKNKISKYIIITLIVILISSILNSKVIIADENKTHQNIIYSVSDEEDFCSMLPYCIENNIPLFISNRNNDEAVTDFSRAYNGEIDDLESKDIISLIKNKYDSDTLIISSSKDMRFSILGTQIACKLRCPIIFQQNTKDFFTNNYHKYKKVIVLGDSNFKDMNVPEIIKINSFDEMEKFYNSEINDAKLNVYIENNQNDVYGLYLAAYRGGKIYFNLDSIKDINQYFAWVIQPEDFSQSKYLELLSYIENKTKRKYDKGIGIITGKTQEDINLLLLRSFFYEEMKKGNNMLEVQPLLDKKNSIINGKNIEYCTISDHITNINDVFNKMKNSKYIKLFGHGSTDKIELENNIDINSNNFPNLKSSLIIAESCSTCEYLDQDSIALSAIHNGAVAYVGSIKTGGVEGPFTDQSYLYSTKDIPLSNLVLANNIEIKKYIDNSFRAVLIGDPLWSMFQDTGNWNGNSRYEYKLPYDLLGKNIIPIKFKDGFNVKGVSIIKNGSKSNQNTEINEEINMGDTKILYINVNSKEAEGVLKFSDKINLMQFIKKIIRSYAGALDNYIVGFLLISSVNILQIILSCIVLIYLYKSNEIMISLKKNIFLAFISAIILYIFDYIFMPINPSCFLFIYYLLIFIMLNITKKVKNKACALTICSILPIYIMLIIINSNKFMYLYMLPGILTDIIIQLSLYFIMCKLDNINTKRCNKTLLEHN